jgi:hypothetical protein
MPHGITGLERVKSVSTVQTSLLGTENWGHKAVEQSQEF